MLWQRGRRESVGQLSSVGGSGPEGGNRVLLIGLGLAVVYWFVEAFADAFFGEGSVSDRLLPPDANELWMRLVTVGLVVGFAVYVRRAMVRRAQTEERLRVLESAVQNTNDLVLITGAEVEPPGPEIVYVNRAFCEQTGYAAGELLGRSPRILQGPGSDRWVLDQIRNSLEREEDFVGGVPNYRKDGSEFQMEWRISPVRDAAGRLTHWISIQRDRTEAKRAEEALREIREAERRHVARDLHDDVMQDLMDALYSMQVTRQKIRDEGVDVPELEGEVESLREAIAGLRGAINDLRRGDAREQPFGHLLESLVEATRQKAPNLELDLSVEDSFPSELTGPKSLELLRLVQEALVNVRRHSGARRAAVRLDTIGDRAHIEVDDNGRGFDAETAWGGVGLSSMRERAVRLGGSFEILCEPGGGTRVTAEVPLRELVLPARERPLTVAYGEGKDEYRW